MDTIWQYKDMDRFRVMEEIKEIKNITNIQVKELMDILVEREIGIPENIRQLDYRRRVDEYGVGFLKGTRSLGSAFILMLTFSFVITPAMGHFFSTSSVVGVLSWLIFITAGKAFVWLCVFRCIFNARSSALFLASAIFAVGDMLFHLYRLSSFAFSIFL